MSSIPHKGQNSTERWAEDLRNKKILASAIQFSLLQTWAKSSPTVRGEGSHKFWFTRMERASDRES